ncbi:hypothetical protein EVJ58_g10100 [Rhodofomes roseus]|uniref:Uncharacterized protein n=1 Tax=Rhodofomes roseus TaxID=34475 RepID=A0A4Y9XSB8_9APHY|nr:hypothetical protein EVJ58_g10100 [Rhodofomes roseus]
MRGEHEEEEGERARGAQAERAQRLYTQRYALAGHRVSVTALTLHWHACRVVRPAPIPVTAAVLAFPPAFAPPLFRPAFKFLRLFTSTSLASTACSLAPVTFFRTAPLPVLLIGLAVAAPLPLPYARHATLRRALALALAAFAVPSPQPKLPCPFRCRHAFPPSTIAMRTPLLA